MKSMEPPAVNTQQTIELEPDPENPGGVRAFTHMDLSNKAVSDWQDALCDPDRIQEAHQVLSLLFQEAQLGSGRPVLNRLLDHVSAARGLLAAAVTAQINGEHDLLFRLLLDISHLLYFAVEDIAEIEAITSWKTETAH
jgi:hypothetical protein